MRFPPATVLVLGVLFLLGVFLGYTYRLDVYLNMKSILPKPLPTQTEASKLLQSISSKLNQLTSLKTAKESNNAGGKPPIFALFSTWTVKPHKRAIYDNALRIWKQFKPDIQPVLFTEEESERKKAESHGWHTYVPPVVTSNTSKCPSVPVLRDLYRYSMDKYPKTNLFGFANGDLLFGAGLLDTIQSLSRQKFVRDKPVLAIIRRMNLDFVGRKPVHSLDEIPKLHKEKGIDLMSDGSSDAFFTNRLFPWHKIPDLVPGRLGVAMFLVSAARLMNVTVIDLTNTVVMIHMTSSGGNLESWANKGSFCNRNLVDKLKMKPNNYGCGHIFCAPWQTGRRFFQNKTSEVTFSLKQKHEIRKGCFDCKMNLTYTAPKKNWKV